ncbi:MarR family transcriptional regulator [Hwanghaeella grinnelliae]|uniref:MarR family transcriptional regulator n=1 Tax=Hwanghaeella grinnelliae TaxID=2500179 RepID=A0A437QX56_9PROT|nr:MarR family transcriptional regulator [Hwanghaeella grinnelliae]RVU39108.1 MarR family transcriptional regulator [Hwanghaeella grinnelliae]
MADHVARIEAQWGRERPDVPLDGLPIIARARRITLLTRGPIESLFEEHGLNAGEFDVLATLRRSGKPYTVRPTELFTQLMINSSSLTDRLNRLEKAGLIDRPVNREDGRSRLVQLSRHGVQVIDTVFAKDMALENEIVGCLTMDERKALAGLLRKLAVGVEAKYAGTD